MERLAYLIFVVVVGVYFVHYVASTNAIYRKQLRLREHARLKMQSDAEASDDDSFSYIVYDRVDNKVLRTNVNDDVVEYILDAVPVQAEKMLLKQIPDMEWSSHIIAIAHVESERYRSISFISAA